MSVLKDARQKAGCDTEELWFHQRERELIAKMRHNERGLKLIQGGRIPHDEAAEPESPPGQSASATKKAA